MKKINSDFKNSIWPSFTDSMIVTLSIFIFLFLALSIQLSDKDKLLEENKQLKLNIKNTDNELKKYKDKEGVPDKFINCLEKKSNGLMTKDSKGSGVQVKAEFLFDSADANLKSKATSHLDKIATTLNSCFKESEADLKDIDNNLKLIVKILGHTDNDPISDINFRNNWELSTQRAVNVVMELSKRKFSEEHLMAAGFGEFQPLAKPSKKGEKFTEEQKRKNRRITIDVSIEKVK